MASSASLCSVSAGVLLLLLLATDTALGDLQFVRLLYSQERLEQRLDSLTRSVAAIQSALTVCPDGWRGHGNSCFRIFGENLTAVSASEACRQHDWRAQLASLGEEHRQYVHSMLESSEYNQVWIGLRREGDGWRWRNGTPLKCGGDWVSRQPDNYGGDEDCVTYDRTQRFPGWTKGWNDERCVLTVPFICEISLVCRRDH